MSLILNSTVRMKGTVVTAETKMDLRNAVQRSIVTGAESLCSQRTQELLAAPLRRDDTSPRTCD